MAGLLWSGHLQSVQQASACETKAAEFSLTPFISVLCREAIVVTLIQRRKTQTLRGVITAKIITPSKSARIDPIQMQDGFLELMVDRKVDQAIRAMHPDHK